VFLPPHDMRPHPFGHLSAHEFDMGRAEAGQRSAGLLVSGGIKDGMKIWKDQKQFVIRERVDGQVLGEHDSRRVGISIGNTENADTRIFMEDFDERDPLLPPHR